MKFKSSESVVWYHSIFDETGVIIIRVHFSDSDIGQRFYYFELFVVGIVGMLKGSSSFFVIRAFITINLLDTAPRISVEFLNYLVF